MKKECLQNAAIIDWIAERTAKRMRARLGGVLLFDYKRFRILPLQSLIFFLYWAGMLANSSRLKTVENLVFSGFQPSYVENGGNSKSFPVFNIPNTN